MKLAGQIALGILLGLVGLVLAVLLFLLICTLFVRRNKVQQKDSDFFRFFLNRGVHLLIKGSRIRLTVNGREKITALVESGQCFLLVGNHVSLFDPLVTWYAFPEADLGFISKPSNFRIPLFGKIARKCLCLPINRDDDREARSTIELAAQYLREKQVSIGAYPEGTRNHHPEEGLLKFRNGVFKVSEWAGHAPIVVVGLKNTQQIKNDFPWRRTAVELAVLRVLESSELEGKNTLEIGTIVRKELEAYLYPKTD